MNTNIAYLLGAYFGDGHIDYKNYAYQFITVSEDRDFLVHSDDICYTEFAKRGTISKVKNYFKLVICSKKICSFILSHCCSIDDYKQADRYQKKGNLPVLESESHVKSFIMGLMDSDGWIAKCKNGKYIKYSVAFKNTSLASYDIYTLMKSIGLKCGKFRLIKSKASIRNGKLSKSKDAYEWSIEPHNYITKVGFGIERKKQRQMEYLKDRGYA